LPLGFAGPLNFDNSLLPIPLSTTEGALVASVSRGCKAINVLIGILTLICHLIFQNSIARGNKLTVIVYADAMTRAPVLKFKSVTEALWVHRINH
jgi:hydroxymethylglutaryl-CoA reductase (NADPH)